MKRFATLMIRQGILRLGTYPLQLLWELAFNLSLRQRKYINSLSLGFSESYS